MTAPDDELREMALAWLKEHCFPESFAVFGETWAEPLASLLAAAEARGSERMREACAQFVEGRPNSFKPGEHQSMILIRIRALSTAGRSKT